jgi:uncharacterized damage-inducible protein DinB
MTRSNATLHTTSRMLVLLAVVSVLPSAARAQTPAPAQAAIAQELMMQFETSMNKFIALAGAMPAEKYTWSPGEGVMEVGHVFMHVARYNYLYPSENMGVAAPAGVDLDGMEAVRAKEHVVRALEQSRAYVREAVGAMTPEVLAQQTRLYGRDVQSWAVLVQLVAHMNEHLGQSIAYARMNGVAPPWAR